MCLYVSHVCMHVCVPSHIRKTGICKASIKRNASWDKCSICHSCWLCCRMLSMEFWCFALLFRAWSWVCHAIQENWRQGEFPAETCEPDIQTLPLGNLTVAEASEWGDSSKMGFSSRCIFHQLVRGETALWWRRMWRISPHLVLDALGSEDGMHRNEFLLEVFQKSFPGIWEHY